jgi:hypothetical protein
VPDKIFADPSGNFPPESRELSRSEFDRLVVSRAGLRQTAADLAHCGSCMAGATGVRVSEVRYFTVEAVQSES